MSSLPTVMTMQDGDLKGYKKKIPQFSPPQYTEALLGSSPPSFGALEKLEGTWVTYNPHKEEKFYGLHTTSMPSAGTNSESMPGKFHFMSQNYTEELHFKLIPDKVRNRGGTNEQFVGAVEYTQSVKGLDGGGLHEENGMFLYLNETYVHPVDQFAMDKDLMAPDLKIGDSGEKFLPQHSIARSGTIPHGNSIMLLGSDYLPMEGKPKFPTGIDTWDPNHLSIHPSMAVVLTDDDVVGPHDLDRPAPEWAVNPIETPSARQYIQRIFQHELYPYSVRPDMRLRDAIQGQEIKEHILFDLNSKYEAGAQGGILNTPLVQKYSPVTEMRFRMWLETVIEDGKEVLQLQYEQICFMEFSFFLDGSLTRWPHIQVNTLRKKEDC